MLKKLRYLFLRIGCKKYLICSPRIGRQIRNDLLQTSFAVDIGQLLFVNSANVNTYQICTRSLFSHVGN